MPILKVTFMFRQRGTGWSESWYKSVPGTDLQTAYDALPLATKRVAISGTQTFLEGIRYSFTDIDRDSILHLTGTSLQGGPPTQESDAPTTALLLRCSAIGFVARKFAYLRGIWDSVVKEGGVYQPTPAYEPRMASLIAALIADEMGWIGQGTKTKANISGMVLNANGTVTITFSADLFGAGPTYADRLVRISGVACGTFPNGSVIMRPSATNSATTVKRIRALPWMTGGRGSVAPPLFRRIFAAGVSRVVERKTGRVFFVSRGRRPAQGAA